jgi:hypothetical protein
MFANSPTDSWKLKLNYFLLSHHHDNFILLGKPAKNKFLFSTAAYEQLVNCLFRGRTTGLYLVSSGI